MHISLVAVLVGAVIAGLLYLFGKWFLSVLKLVDPFGRVAFIAMILICVLVFLGYAVGRFPVPLVTL